MRDLICVGDVMLDVIGPAPVGPRTHAALRVRAGGSAVNAARTAAGLGARATVVGRVGNDGPGRLIADELGRLGIEVLLARDDVLATGTTVSLGGAIVADRGANAGFGANDVPAVLDARVVLVSGYQLFHDDSAPGARAALERARGLVAVDLAAPSLARDVAADILLGPAAAFVAVWGGTLEEALADAAHGREAAVATRGRDGATAAARRQLVHARAEPHDGDPLGAGDAFAAVFLLAHADGMPLADALARACSAGAAA